jgi:hypothetical protein
MRPRPSCKAPNVVKSVKIARPGISEYQYRQPNFASSVARLLLPVGATECKYTNPRRHSGPHPHLTALYLTRTMCPFFAALHAEPIFSRLLLVRWWPGFGLGSGYYRGLLDLAHLVLIAKECRLCPVKRMRDKGCKHQWMS